MLILSGQNNHAWQETTPKLREILERRGDIQADVLEYPETMTAESIAPYGAIVSNWNSWGDVSVKEWPDAARDALIAFVRGGKGFVSVHAGSSSFYGWKEYQELGITAWDLEKTGHGKQHTFTVTPSGTDHPITRGMAPFSTFDELWHRVPVPPDAQVLATAWSSPEFGGTGEAEPLVFARAFGQGRSVNVLLGHHVRAMSHPAFAELLTRAVEWAATGAVTPRPRALEWVQSDRDLALKLNGEVLWQFNFGEDTRKPYFHPLNLAGGPTLTWEAPPDHPWHHGLWFSWKYIDGVNFWEEDRETGKSEGATLWDAPDIKRQPDGAARIDMKLRYETEPGNAVLLERRVIEVSPPDWLGVYTMDWFSEFTAMAPEVLLDRTPIAGEPHGKSWGGYAGLSVRFNAMTDPEVCAESGPVALDESQVNLDADALDFSGVIGGSTCGVAILSSPHNAVRPTPWYVIARTDNSFYYFSPALLYRAPRTLKAGERLVLQYRIAVHAGAWSQAQLNEGLETIRNGMAAPEATP